MLIQSVCFRCWFFYFLDCCSLGSLLLSFLPLFQVFVSRTDSCLLDHFKLFCLNAETNSIQYTLLSTFSVSLMEVLGDYHIYLSFWLFSGLLLPWSLTNELKKDPRFICLRTYASILLLSALHFAEQRTHLIMITA